MAERLRVAFAASEVSPWASTGGLGEVAAALPGALAEAGCDIATFLPCYRSLRAKVYERGARLVDTGIGTRVPVGAHWLEGRLLRIDGAPGSASAPPVYALDFPHLFDREGIYGHSDDAARFATFCRGVLDCAPRALGGPLDIVHAHDWHAALLPVYLRGPYGHLQPHTASVLTIHNMGYPGAFAASELHVAGLGAEWLHFERMEFHGHVSFLKGGIVCADVVTTVSPRYAAEIQTPEFGEHLDGLLRANSAKLIGILNGVDGSVWNPATDPHIAARYDTADLGGRAACRRQLLEFARMDPDDPHPIFGIVSRIVHQKGLDLVAELVPWLAARGVRVLLLGTGERALQEWFQERERQFPHHMRVQLEHSPRLAHILNAGADAVLVPSRYEPCGLAQMYAMRYGAVPIVRDVGGLHDTVVHAMPETLAAGTATGFRFRHGDAGGLAWACNEALKMFYTRPADWAQVQRNGMTRDFSWDTSAARYVATYKHAIARRRRN